MTVGLGWHAASTTVDQRQAEKDMTLGKGWLVIPWWIKHTSDLYLVLATAQRQRVAVGFESKPYLTGGSMGA